MRMKVEVEVISKQIIKPSSPTPEHLRRYQLSILDQMAPLIYIPLVFFYTPEENPVVHFLSHDDKSSHIKQSLSQVLTHFYPLAGRVKNNSYVDCNDEGAHYLEAKANGKVADFISNPDLADLHKFLPYKNDDFDELVVAVKVNFFDCGGMAIGISLSHKLADAMSFCMFINSWSAVARGDIGNVVQPQFDAAKLFPPRNITGYDPAVGMVKSDPVTRRYVFTASKILSLREKYAKSASSSTELPLRPTRVEALSAFLWSRFMAATQNKEEDTTSKTYAVVHAVNLRTKVDPPLPQNSFGNMYTAVIAVPNLEVGCGVLKEMRSAISKVDSGFFRELGQNESYLKFAKEQAERFGRGEIVPFSFSSFCRFPLYGADFGWGKPMWVTSATMNFNNLVVFMDTRMEDGIEICINLKKEDMEKFEVDHEFLSYASPLSNNPK